jgi:hypothetical protein
MHLETAALQSRRLLFYFTVKRSRYARSRMALGEALAFAYDTLRLSAPHLRDLEWSLVQPRSFGSHHRDDWEAIGPQPD